MRLLVIPQPGAYYFSIMQNIFTIDDKNCELDQSEVGDINFKCSPWMHKSLFL